MNLSKPFIKRPVLTTLVMVVFIVFGVLAFRSLPVSSMPELQYPIIQVTTNYPGSSPDQVSRLISSPLENQFMLMEGIEFVSSANTYETSTIILQFHLDIDINIAAQEVEQAIQKALAQLPSDLPQNPVYIKFNPSDTPIFYLVMYSPVVPSWDIYNYGYTFLGQQIGTVEGVANVTVYGYPYAVRVKADPEALAAKNISLNDLANAVRNGNSEQPTGKFYGPNSSVVNVSRGQLTKAKEYEPLVIKIVNGSPVRIQDIGRAEDSLQQDKQNFKWVTKDFPEGQGACVLVINKQLGYNTVETCNGIEKLLSKLTPQLPKSIKFEVPFTLATWIQEAVFDVEFTLGIAFLLVVLVIYFYLGRVKNSIIPLITLPITVTNTFIFMKLFHYTLDIMSLSALTLAIGFLVDDAIIVLENIVRWAQEKGLSAYDAALEGSKQIILCVVAISLCLCAVFIPMMFLAGAVGQIFSEFAAVIVISVFTSGFISVSLTPMLASRFVATYDSSRQTKIERFGKLLNDKLLNVYSPLLEKSLNHKLIIISGALATVVFSGIIFCMMPQEFLPGDDLGVVQGFLQAPEGTSPEKMQTYLNDICKISIDHPFVKNIASLSSTPTDNQAVFFLNLTNSKRANIWTVIDELQEEYKQVVGAQAFLKAFPLINLQLGGITAGKANYQYVLQSFESKDLYGATEKLLERLHASPKLSSISSDYQPNAPALNVSLLRDAAYSYGDVSALQTENTFKYAYGENYVSKINVPQDMFYAIVEVEKPYLQDPSDLSSLYLSNNMGGENNQVAVRSITDTKIITRPETVNHLNALPSVTISFNPAANTPLSEALNELETIAKEVLPTNVSTHLVGNTAAFEQTMKQFIFLVFIAIFVVYIILGILYENFIYPIPALSAIPVALLGGLLALLISGNTLSIYALVGLIMLLGIVMKNGILIIDFALEIMENEKVDAEKAIIKACKLRFRPIVMTTIAAMMGALPIALGIGGTIAKGRAPLGIAVVGGLIFAQVITLFVIPVTFIYIHRFNAYCKARFALFQ